MVTVEEQIGFMIGYLVGIVCLGLALIIAAKIRDRDENNNDER